jgi:uncharacterized protein
VGSGSRAMAIRVEEVPMGSFRFALFLVIAAAALSPAAARAAGAGPSFDCRKASTAVEHEICRKPYLAAYDRQIAELYPQALGVLDAEDADQLRADQRAWLKVRDECNYQTPANPHATTDVEGCLAGTLMFRVNELQKVMTDKKFSRPCHPQNC